MLRNSLLAFSVLVAGGSVADAQSCDANAQFASHRTSHGSVRAQYNAMRRGEWRQAIHFGRETVESGTSPRHKTAAWTNLCSAYAQSGNLEQALTACDTAVEMDANSWRAQNNLGAANWAAGNYDIARIAFQAAVALASDEDAVAANAQLVRCTAN